jgi:hypothetical protein
MLELRQVNVLINVHDRNWRSSACNHSRNTNSTISIPLGLCFSVVDRDNEKPLYLNRPISQRFTARRATSSNSWLQCRYPHIDVQLGIAYISISYTTAQVRYPIVPLLQVPLPRLELNSLGWLSHLVIYIGMRGGIQSEVLLCSKAGALFNESCSRTTWTLS